MTTKHELAKSGAYGRVVYPACNQIMVQSVCRACRNRKWVVKWMCGVRGSAEFEAAKQLAEKDPLCKHFVGLSLSSKPLPHDYACQDCMLAIKNIASSQNHTHVQGYWMPHAGESYQQCLTGYLSSSGATKHTYSLIQDFLRVARILNILHNECKMVHRDVKAMNLVCHGGSSSMQKVIRLVDFGLSLSLTENHSTLKTNMKPYALWPPEANALFTTFRSSVNVQADWLNWIKTKEAQDWSLWLLLFARDNTCHANYIFAMQQLAPKYPPEIFSKMLQSTDAYMTGNIWLRYVNNDFLPWIKCHVEDEDENSMMQALLSEWKKRVLIPLIHPYWEQRMTLAQAIKITSELVCLQADSKSCDDQPLFEQCFSSLLRKNQQQQHQYQSAHCPIEVSKPKSAPHQPMASSMYRTEEKENNKSKTHQSFVGVSFSEKKVSEEQEKSSKILSLRNATMVSDKIVEQQFQLLSLQKSSRRILLQKEEERFEVKPSRRKDEDRSLASDSVSRSRSYYQQQHHKQQQQQQHDAEVFDFRLVSSASKQ